MARQLVVAVALAGCVFAAGPMAARAQLLSPGRLAQAHGALEGLRNCTACHQLGTRGVSAERCLGCHEALRARVSQGLGYHATPKTRECASCHQDHLGEDFALVRLDEDSFEHTVTGFTLEQSHAELGCRSCHQPSHVRDPLVASLKRERGALDRTFLGLRSACADCHAAESPHGDQFGPRTCAECHDAGVWSVPPAFDHEQTAFPLEGIHRQVACSDCHGAGTSARYRPLPFQGCDGCHSDPHRGAMQGGCSSCHGPEGWHAVAPGALGSSFDHTRTSFPLRGAHAAAECSSCHRTGRPPATELVRMTYRPDTADRAYPAPVADGCASCHVDRHATPALDRRWVGCAGCHGESAWSPAGFGISEHATSAFPLTGAHVATPCVACHIPTEQGRERFVLAVEGRSCADCHAAEDPHEGRFGARACATCHVTDAFDRVVYDHAESTEAPSGCAGCHGPDDPHAGQFPERECSECHVTETFAIEAFDHGATRFPLDGAHEGADCASCHVAAGTDPQGPVRYRPLDFDCADCHGSVS
jgi:hypothetical protein